MWIVVTRCERPGHPISAELQSAVIVGDVVVCHAPDDVSSAPQVHENEGSKFRELRSPASSYRS